MRECIEHVGQCRNARGQWDCGSRGIARIARSIPPLMVISSDLLGHLHVGDVALRQKLRADSRMGTHDLRFGFIQLCRLEEDRVRHANLSYIVQSRGELNHKAGVIIAPEFLSQER